MALEVDQKALTRLLLRQVGTRWVLLRWHGQEQLVLHSVRLSITPLGIYLAGVLESRSPSFKVVLEVRVRPRVNGSTVVIAPGSVAVTRPAGVWGIVPRRILSGWLSSGAGRRWLAAASLDLAPLLAALGAPKKYAIGLKLGFGRLTLVLRL